jgi:pyruvate,orthophosphate dikinase
MEDNRSSIQTIREFIANGGLERAEPSLDMVELSAGAKLITEAQVLTSGVACASLIPLSDTVALFDLQNKPVLLCESCREIELSLVDRVSGIITSVGDVTSHIVLRARALSIPVIRVDEEQKKALESLYYNSVITIIAGRGKASVISGEAKLKNTGDWEYLSEMAITTKPYRAVNVRANIDDHVDASKAMSAGADGIGMWRTENYLLKINRGKVLRQLLSDIACQRSSVNDNKLDEVTEIMTSELLLILKAVQDKPFVIRLLDLPLVEMLTDEFSEMSDIDELNVSKSKVKNPLLSIRGARLGIVFPEIAIFQLRAVCQAMERSLNEGICPDLQILIPFITYVSEITWYRNIFSHISSSQDISGTNRYSVKFGANIETPRGAITAGEIAKVSDFFSFGTNDLTQYTWAIDRDSGASEMIDSYIQSDVLAENPFAEFDYPGIGFLIEKAIKDGRASNSKLSLGVTGNFGSQLGLTDYFCDLGINYVGIPVALVPIVALAYAKQFLIRA